MDEANLRKNWSSNFCFKWQSDIREYNSSVLTLNHRRSDWLFVESRALRQNNLLSDNFGKLEIGRFSSLSLLHQILTQCSNLRLYIHSFTILVQVQSQVYFCCFIILIICKRIMNICFGPLPSSTKIMVWSCFFSQKNVYFRLNLLWISSSDCHLKYSI